MLMMILYFLNFYIYFNYNFLTLKYPYNLFLIK